MTVSYQQLHCFIGTFYNCNYDMITFIDCLFKQYLDFQMLGLSSGTNMRGLNEFISDIRACKDKDSEAKRVDIQLAKIRERFTTEKGLNAYQRKKYVWKLLYIHILGYQVQFGYQEAASLINSSKYDQKYTGYVAAGILISESNEGIWKSIIHAIQSDLRSRNEPAQLLAFSMIATIVPDALIANVSDTIIEIALTNKVSVSVRRKAILCLSRILKKNPNKYDSKKFVNPICEMLEKRDCTMSFLNSTASLVLTLQQIFNPEHLKEALPRVARLLHKLAINKQCPTQYLYFTIPNPWLQMKLYQILQQWSPPQQKGILSLIEQTLSKVLKRTDASKSINKNNAEYGLLFEAINVIIHYDQRLNPKMMQDLSKILAVFIASTQANIRYLGLEAMCRLAIKHDLSKHENKILSNLDDSDISIRRRALQLLYLICNSKNAYGIVAQLIGYLQSRNDPLIRDDLVLKIALLAEKFSQNFLRYVDVVVKLIKNAEVENDIWYRILQIITGFGTHNTELHFYAAQRMYGALMVPHITDTMKCVGSYVVSQFSEQLVKSGKQPQQIFQVINKHFQTANNKSKAMMLNAFAKLAIKYDVLRQQIQMIFHLSSGHWDADVQQRGVQFLVLLDKNPQIQKKILSMNPAFTQQQQLSNPLLKKFGKGGKKMKENDTIKSQVKSFETTNDGGSRNDNPSSHPLAGHPCYRQALDRLCKNSINLMDVPSKLQLKPYFKEALIKKAPFENVEMKQKLEDGSLKVILLMSVATKQMQFKVFRSKGFDVDHSPIKYGEGTQQIMLVFTPNGEKTEPPNVGIAWKNSNGQIQKKQIQLPVVISKFLNPVELTLDKFRQFYNDYSLPNQKFHKLDGFLKMPQGAKGHDFLKKVGSFLSSVCRFKCGANPSFDSIKQIYGGATLQLKDDKGKVTNIPILVEAEVYTTGTVSAARISLRGGNGPAVASIYQLILSFLN